VFENRVWRRIFGPERDEVTGEWRKLHNEKLYNLYCSPNITWIIKSSMRWAVHVSRIGLRRGAYGVLVGIPEGKRRLGICRRRWQKDNIKMGLQKMGWIWLRIGTGGGLLWTRV
jgi:hypothetical protein